MTIWYSKNKNKELNLPYNSNWVSVIEPTESGDVKLPQVNKNYFYIKDDLNVVIIPPDNPVTNDYFSLFNNSNVDLHVGKEAITYLKNIANLQKGELVFVMPPGSLWTFVWSSNSWLLSKTTDGWFNDRSNLEEAQPRLGETYAATTDQYINYSQILKKGDYFFVTTFGAEGVIASQTGTTATIAGFSGEADRVISNYQLPTDSMFMYQYQEFGVRITQITSFYNDEALVSRVTALESKPSSQTVEVIKTTEAAYNALTEEQKSDSTKIYYIPVE